jgi:hypothetical protein
MKENKQRSLFVRIPYTATFVETIDDKWVILDTRYANGSIRFYSVMLKPSRWMQMDKDEIPNSNEPLVGYTYNQDGPFGYQSSTVELARERIYSLSEDLRPPVTPEPIILVAPEPTPTPLPVEKYHLPKHKRVSDMTEKERREHNRRLRLIRFAKAAAKVQSQ